MGAFWTRGAGLVAMVSEIVGYKTGVALSRDQMTEMLRDFIDTDGFFDVDEDARVRVRSEDLEAAVHQLLFKLGRTRTPRLVHPAIDLHHRYKKKPRELERALEVLEDWEAFMVAEVERARTSGDRVVHPTPFLEQVVERHGYFGAKVALRLFEDMNTMVFQNPWNRVRVHEWGDVVELEELFQSESLTPFYGRFFDQRFIDYLGRNFDDIDRINWRKFEGFVGEYFHREGFQVALGPGRDDGNIDARVWPIDEDTERPPALLVQCKRQKDAVSKVVVKALWADVVHEKAQGGLIVTTSALAPGAKKVCSARSYPIASAERGALRKWIEVMRSPGNGVFLGE